MDISSKNHTQKIWSGAVVLTFFSSSDDEFNVGIPVLGVVLVVEVDQGLDVLGVILLDLVRTGIVYLGNGYRTAHNHVDGLPRKIRP